MSDQTGSDAAQWRALTPEQREAIGRHLAVEKLAPAPMVAPIATSSRKTKDARAGRTVLIVGGGLLAAVILYGLLNGAPAPPIKAALADAADVTP